MFLTSSRLRQWNDSSSPSGGIQRNRNPKGILSGQLIGGAVSENRTFPNGACLEGNRVFFVVFWVQLKYTIRIDHISGSFSFASSNYAKSDFAFLRFILRYVGLLYRMDSPLWNQSTNSQSNSKYNQFVFGESTPTLHSLKKMAQQRLGVGLPLIAVPLGIENARWDKCLLFVSFKKAPKN